MLLSLKKEIKSDNLKTKQFSPKKKGIISCKYILTTIGPAISVFGGTLARK